MASFHPGARVILRLRLDEGRDTKPLIDALQRQNIAAARAAASPQSNSTAAGGVIRPGATPPQQRRAITSAKLAQAARKGKQDPRALAAENAEIEAARKAIDVGRQGLPAGLTDGVDRGKTIDFEVRPRSVDIERSSTIDAFRATVRLSYSSLPFDPRIVRSVGVVIMLGEVTEDEFARGIGGERQAVGGERVSPDRLPYLSELPRSFGLIRFEGFADSWNVSFGDKDEIEITARDLSGVLRDQRLPDGFGIDLNLPITDGVRGLINRFEGLRGIPVIFAPAQDLSEEQISAILTDPNIGAGQGPIPAASQSRLKPKVGKNGKPGKPTAPKKGKNSSLWDHVTEVCAKIGLMPVMRGRIIYIQTAQAQAKAGEPWVLFYGRDLLELQLQRKLEGINQQTVEVRVPDPTIGRTRWARYPVLQGERKSGVLGITNPVQSRANKVTPAGTPEEKILTFEFSRVDDGKTLEDMAKQIFEQVARQEISASAKTRMLRAQKVARKSTGRAGRAQLETRSLLEIYPGDSVLLLVAQAQQVAEQLRSDVTVVQQTYKELTQANFARRMEYLRSLGLSQKTAEQIAKAQELVNNGSRFQVHGTRFSYSADDGITVELDLQNFITVRDEESDGAIRAAQDAAILVARMTTRVSGARL